MTDGQKLVVTARALIIYEDRLLLFKLRTEDSFWCLPGGKLDPGESITQAIKRELVEETGIEPQVGRVVAGQDLLTNKEHRVEFFFEIKNPADYLEIDFSRSSHGSEISAAEFVDLETSNYSVLPNDLKKLMAEINKVGFAAVPYRLYENQAKYLTL